MKRIGKKVLGAALLWSAVSSASFAQSTEEVWQHHIDAWQAQDLAAIVADYSEDSLLILNHQIFKGPSEIRDVFAQLFRIFSLGENRLDPATLDGRMVFITWHYNPRGDQEFFGTDTFVIESGKIMVQTIASPLYERFPIKR